MQHTFIHLRSVCPSLPKEGIKSLRISQDAHIPQGDYHYLEFYCVDPKCDCQLVRFLVTDENGKIQATFGYGWKDKAFYDVVFSNQDHHFPGPALEPTGQQGPYSNEFLDMFKEGLLLDTSYINQVKQHYAQFKEESKKRDLFALGESISPSLASTRNSPCHCGSNKKYRKCHLKSDLQKQRYQAKRES